MDKMTVMLYKDITNGNPVLCLYHYLVITWFNLIEIMKNSDNQPYYKMEKTYN